MNSILEVAHRRPGLLLGEGLQAMSRFVSNQQPGAGGPEKLSGHAVRYLTTALQASGRSPLSVRGEREMRTVAHAIDALTEGRLAEAGDVLMQRFKAVEMAETDQSWAVAQRMELIPRRDISSVSSAERAAAVHAELAERRLAGYTDRNRSRTS